MFILQSPIRGARGRGIFFKWLLHHISFNLLQRRGQLVCSPNKPIGLKLVWKLPKYYYCPLWRRCIFLVCRNRSNYSLSVIMIYISSLLQLLMIYIFPGCRFSQVSANIFILIISCNGFLRSVFQPWRILEERKNI